MQIDELWHFINGKKTKFGFGVPLAREALCWQLGNRSDTDLKKLIKRVDQSDCDFVTDEWSGFFRCLPEKRHFCGKDLTFPIEATNSDIRHRLARYSKEGQKLHLEMVEASLKLFHYFQDYPQNVFAFITPLLSFFG